MAKSAGESEESTSEGLVINDLIRKARRQEGEIEYIRTKLLKAEKSGFTDKTATEILASLKDEAQRHRQFAVRIALNCSRAKTDSLKRAFRNVLGFEFFKISQNFVDDLLSGFLNVFVGSIFFQHKFCCRHIRIHGDDGAR